MISTAEQEKNSKIQEIIKAISVHQTDDDLKKQIEALNKVYDGSFRHSYSQVLITIQNLNESERDLLMTNIEHVLGISNDLSAHAKKGFMKLSDHIQLDISRLNYYKKEFGKESASLREGMEKAQKESVSLREGMEKARVEQNNAMIKYTELSEQIVRHEKDISSVKSESITILSIFAAIMLAGMGGLTILGNIATVIKDISMSYFFVITSFLGLVLFNVVFMLIYMIARLTGRNIYTTCTDSKKYHNSDCTVNGCDNGCCGINRIRKRLPYIFWTNATLLFILGVSLLGSYWDKFIT